MCWPGMQALLSDDLHPVVIEVSPSMALLCCNTCFITALLTAGTLEICAAGNKVKLLFTRTMRLALWLNSSFSFLCFSSQQSGVFFSATSAAIKSLFCGRRAGRSDFKRGEKIKVLRSECVHTVRLQNRARAEAPEGGKSSPQPSPLRGSEF